VQRIIRAKLVAIEQWQFNERPLATFQPEEQLIETGRNLP
jgi:hypothetical protein